MREKETIKIIKKLGNDKRGRGVKRMILKDERREKVTITEREKQKGQLYIDERRRKRINHFEGGGVVERINLRAKGKEGERESAHFEGERGREGFGQREERN